MIFLSKTLPLSQDKDECLSQKSCIHILCSISKGSRDSNTTTAANETSSFAPCNEITPSDAYDSIHDALAKKETVLRETAEFTWKSRIG